MGMEVELCPAPPHKDSPVPSALSFARLHLAHIRGGVWDQGLDPFLYAMNVITKVLNPQYGQPLALINLATSV